MSTTRVEPETKTIDEPTFTSRRPLDYVPGILLLIAVGLLGKYAQIWWNALAKHEHWHAPDIEYVLWAIVIGLLITNTIGLHRIFRPGVQTYEFWLKIGIVVLGARFVLGDIAKLGGLSLIQILVDMTVAGTIIILAARAFGLSGKLGSLLAIGTSICGVSAIVAAKGAIRARNSDVSYAIAAILALGAVALFALPPLGARDRPDRPRVRPVGGPGGGQHRRNHGHRLPVFRRRPARSPCWSSPTRNALIGFVVLGFALYWAARGQADEIAPGARGQGRVHLGQVPEIRARLPGRLGDRDRALAAPRAKPPTSPTCRNGRSCSPSPASGSTPISARSRAPGGDRSSSPSSGSPSSRRYRWASSC